MKIEYGKKASAIKAVLYGPGGIGKSTLASQFPNPIFDDLEAGTGQLDIARFPTAEKLEDIEEHINYLKTQPHDFQTYVIDSGDYLQALCVSKVCDEAGVTGIEKIGYGKGYSFLADEFRKILNSLNELIAIGINVVLICHCMITKFELPNEQSSFDRYSLKLQSSSRNSVADLVKEWSDLMLFLNFETYVIKTDDGKAKGQGGRRVMFTTYHPCWDAKNRFGLRDKLPLDYKEIANIIPAIKKGDILRPITKQLYAKMAEDNILPKEISAISRKNYSEDVILDQYDERYIAALLDNWEGVKRAVERYRKTVPEPVPGKLI